MNILVLIAGLLIGGGQEKPKPVAVGQKVPDFTVTTLEGKKLSRADLRRDSQPVVLSFWCTFCHSCRDVEKQVAKLASDYEGKAVVIALDASAGETAEKVAKFLKRKQLPLRVVLDPTARTADLFGTELTTTTAVIDAQGVLRYCGRFADRNHTYAEDALKALLARKEVPVKTTPHEG